VETRDPRQAAGTLRQKSGSGRALPDVITRGQGFRGEAPGFEMSKTARSAG